MNTGDKIKEYRKEKKITQKQLGQLIGKAEITIRKYESGALVPPLETLYSIAKALDIPVENLTQTKKVTFQAKMLCKAIVNGFEISGLSKEDFCSKLDITIDELERYISGISIPSLKLIEATSDLTNKSLNDFSKETEEKQKLNLLDNEQVKEMNRDFMKATENEELCTTIAMEECAELIQAISKAKRDKLDADNMAEEIADVLISIEWVKEIYSIDTLEIQKWIDYKQNRIVTRLGNGNLD